MEVQRQGLYPVQDAGRPLGGILEKAVLKIEQVFPNPQAGPQYRSPDGIIGGVLANQTETEAEAEPAHPPGPRLGIVPLEVPRGDPRLG